MELSPLRQRGVRALLAAEVVSKTGTQMSWLALPWFVLVTTGSAKKMTAVLATELIAAGLAGAASGRVADRFGLRGTLLLCDIARAPLIAAIPTLHLMHELSFPVLLGLVFLYGAFSMPSFAAQEAIVPALVGDDETRLGQAAALFQGANRLTILLGPPVAGILIGIFGATGVLYIDGATYVVSVALVLAWVPAVAVTHESEETRGMRAALRFIRGERLVRTWIVSFVWIDVAWQGIFAALPVLVYESYGKDAKVLGWMLAGFGAGAFLGSAVAYRLVRSADALLLACLAILGQTAPTWLIPFDFPAWVIVGAFFAAGVFNPIVNAPSRAIMAMRVPAALRPTVFSLSVTSTAVLAPLALLIIGPLLASVGPRPVILVLIAIQTAGVLIFFTAGMRARAREGAIAGEALLAD
jgi:MFS family permease